MNYNTETYPHICPDTTYGRVYKIGPDGPYFGSVSTITHYGIPIDEHLMKYIIEQSGGDYMKSVSFHGEATEIGTCVHSLAERYLRGEVIELPDDIDMSTLVPGRGYIPTYQTLEQIRKGFLSFIRFWEHNQLELMHQEELVWDTTKDEKGDYIHPYAGRFDMTARSPDGQVWLLDLKTSKMVKKMINYQVQLSMYKQIAEAKLGIKIDRIGIVHCNKMFKKAEPPKSVLDIVEYEYRPDLVHAAYTMFAAKFKGYAGIGTGPKIKPKTPTVFSLGG